MFRLSLRFIATLLVALSITAVNGGVLAVASNWDEAAATPVASQVAVETALFSGHVESCCDDVDTTPQVRSNTASCKAGSAECGGPLPIVGTVSAGSTDPWLIYAASAHRDYLGEHQLRPPRI